MFIRTKKVKDRMGKVHEYEQLVESYRVHGKVKQRVIMTLGKKGDIPKGHVQKIIGALAKKDPTMQMLRHFDQKAPDLKIHASKQYGAYFVFRHIWEKLHLEKAVSKIAPKRNEKEFSEMIYLLTLYRILSPGSELKMTRMFEPKIHHQMARVPQLNQWYRAISHLQKNRETVENIVYESISGLFQESMRLLYFDTTSVILFGEYGKSDLARYGYSKEKRSDKKQIIVGLVLTESSLPIGITEEIGNQNDMKNFVSMLNKMKQKYETDEMIFVGDKGMNSKANRGRLKEEKQQYILGVRAQNEKAVKVLISSRQISFEKAEALELSGNQIRLIKKLQQRGVQEDLRTKVTEQTIGTRRMIFFFNPIEKEASKRTREVMISALQKKHIKTVGDLKQLIGNKGYRSLLSIGKVRQGENIEVKIDEERLRQLECFDGITVVETNTDLPAKEVARQYKQLITVEQSFSDLKSTMECRPIYHKTDTNIKGHIFINFLGLVLYATLFHFLGNGFDEKARYEIIEALKEIQTHDVEENGRRYMVRTELTPMFQNICSLLKLKPPNRILGA